MGYDLNTVYDRWDHVASIAFELVCCICKSDKQLQVPGRCGGTVLHISTVDVSLSAEGT